MNKIKKITYNKYEQDQEYEYVLTQYTGSWIKNVTKCWLNIPYNTIYTLEPC